MQSGLLGRRVAPHARDAQGVCPWKRLSARNRFALSCARQIDSDPTGRKDHALGLVLQEKFWIRHRKIDSGEPESFQCGDSRWLGRCGVGGGLAFRQCGAIDFAEGIGEFHCAFFHSENGKES